MNALNDKTYYLMKHYKNKSDLDVLECFDKALSIKPYNFNTMIKKGITYNLHVKFLNLSNALMK
jgi:hypothetical protein